MVKLWYAGEEGSAHGQLREDTQDMEGRWLGLALRGTTMDQLRNWSLTQGARSVFYLAQDVVPTPQRRQVEGLGYLLEIRRQAEGDQEPWMMNCIQEAPAPEETQDLQRVAARLQAPGQEGTPPVPQAEVQEQPPIEGSLGTEHRLRSISRRLPGYLARVSAKEALKLLAAQSGEQLANYQVFGRYYRQVIQGRGGSRGLQRELLTLSSVVDTLLAGEVLSALDILCQRIKGLELLQQGADVNLALQVELVPREQLGLTQDVEGRFAHREYKAESRLMRDLKSSSLQGGKGNWTGPARDQGPGNNPKGKKGKNWEKGKNKGGPPKKGGESPIIAAPPPS
eukprot:s1282_g4.t1